MNPLLAEPMVLTKYIERMGIRMIDGRSNVWNFSDAGSACFPMSRIEELLKEVVRGNQLMFRIFISGVQKELVGDDSPFNKILYRHLLRIMRIKSF